MYCSTTFKGNQEVGDLPVAPTSAWIEDLEASGSSLGRPNGCPYRRLGRGRFAFQKKNTGTPVTTMIKPGQV